MTKYGQACLRAYDSVGEARASLGKRDSRRRCGATPVRPLSLRDAPTTPHYNASRRGLHLV